MNWFRNVNGLEISAAINTNGWRENALYELRDKRQQKLLRKNLERHQEKHNCADRKYKQALREPRNEKQRQRNRLVWENLERYM
jgi:hypothetical protein